MDRPLKVGDRFKWNDRIWTIIRIGGGKVFCTTPGLHNTQIIPWLTLCNLLFDGKATRMES